MHNEDSHRSLYESVELSLKSGKLNRFTRKDLAEIDAVVASPGRAQSQVSLGQHTLQANFLKLQLYLSRIKREPSHKWTPLDLKALCLSLEFRDYLGGLSEHEATDLEIRAKSFIKKIQERNNQPADLLKEQVRLVCVHANQLYRGRKLNEKLLGILKRAITTKLQPAHKCRPILGSLYFLEGKLFREKGKYRQCEESLGKSIDAYADWACEHHSNLTAASYRTAMSLGIIAWVKNMSGFNRDALTIINSARILIRHTEWSLDKAHLDLIYADISRTFASANSSEMKDAIKIARESYEVFRRLGHERLKARAAFTLALLYYYVDADGDAEHYLEEVKDFSNPLKDKRWLSNYYILLARIRNKQSEYSKSLELLDEALSLSKEGKISDRIVVAEIVKSESHVGLGQYGRALRSLERAQAENEKKQGKGVNSERNRAWIFLDYARTYLRNNDLGSARFFLNQWSEIKDMEYQLLSDSAKKIEDELYEATPDFIIKKEVDNLDWKLRSFELLQWLEKLAIARTSVRTDEELAEMLNISRAALGTLRSKGHSHRHSSR